MRRSLFTGTLALVCLASAGVAAAGPISLTGIIRDISALPTGSPGAPVGVQKHPDFEFPLTVPDGSGGMRAYGGNGPHAGMVASTLGADGTPVFVNGGCSAVFPTECSIASAASFSSWYHNDPSFNTSALYTITLNETSPGSGLFQYSSNAFFPIDGQLFGNQGFDDTPGAGGIPHNYHFTYQLHTSFNYQAGQSFAFSGDDDLWVFINKKLAIDLGGIHTALFGSVSLDAIAASHGLTLGQNYDLDLFFAERHTVASNFTVTTSIASLQSDLSAVPEPGSLVLLGTGLAGVLVWRRRRS